MTSFFNSILLPLLSFCITNLKRTEKLFAWFQRNIRDSHNSKISTSSPVELPERVCHYHELFINNKGEVFPCCFVWQRADMKIGHVDEPMLFQSLETFYSPCSQCRRVKLKKAVKSDRQEYGLINFELSLACQGDCAMCCVDASAWRGRYEYYDGCLTLLDRLRPKRIVLQGGEVLVQKHSLEWVEEIRRRHPDMIIRVITNGNVPEAMSERVEHLFDELVVSIVGFQPETYTRIMEMNRDRTLHFVERLAGRGKLRWLQVKFLTTPINLHETNLFLQWGLQLNNVTLHIIDASTSKYINPAAPHHYWEKIFHRTGKEVRSLLVSHQKMLQEKNVKIEIHDSLLKLLGLEQDFETFLQEHELSTVITRLVHA